MTSDGSVNEETSEETAHARLNSVLPFPDIAVKGARLDQPEAEILFGILARMQDGTGRIMCSFKVEQFLEDLKELVGYDQAKVDEEFAQALADARLGDPEGES